MKHDLARGAEVTINYGTGKHSTLNRRQQHLFERFSFDCACDRCLAEEATEDADETEDSETEGEGAESEGDDDEREWEGEERSEWEEGPEEEVDPWRDKAWE